MELVFDGRGERIVRVFQVRDIGFHRLNALFTPIEIPFEVLDVVHEVLKRCWGRWPWAFEISATAVGGVPAFRGRPATLRLTTDYVDEFPFFEAAEVVVHAPGGDRDRFPQPASRDTLVCGVNGREQFRLILGDLLVDSVEIECVCIGIIRGHRGISTSHNRITALVITALVQPVSDFPNTILLMEALIVESAGDGQTPVDPWLSRVGLGRLQRVYRAARWSGPLPVAPRTMSETQTERSTLQGVDCLVDSAITPGEVSVK